MRIVWHASDRARLRAVHPDLVTVMTAARQVIPFRITDGVRSLARQAELVAVGASRTMNSRHITGHAVDVVAVVSGQISWAWPLYERIAATVAIVSSDLDIPVVWGGDWPTLRDGPHFELSWARYPA